MFAHRPKKTGSLLLLLIATGASLLALVSCESSTVPKNYSPFDKASVLNEVDVALTRGDCSAAITAIEPLFNSAYSDNDVRMRAAAAYACSAKVNFIGNMLSLISNASDISATPAVFWRLLAKTYNSRIGDDHVVEGAVLSLDALLSVTRPGVLILPQYQVNPGSHNVGSVFYTDRTDESNFALLFSSMATIGGISSRYGLADSSTGEPATVPPNLPWDSVGSFAPNSENGRDGCALAAGVVNFVDSLSALETIAPPSMMSTVNVLTGLFSAGFNSACELACTAPAMAGGCGLTAEVCGTGCSVRLRSRASCTGTAGDVPTCNALGIVKFLKTPPTGWE